MRVFGSQLGNRYWLPSDLTTRPGSCVLTSFPHFPALQEKIDFPTAHKRQGQG